MSVRNGFGVLGAVLLAGCATMAQDAARKEGAAQCRRDGKIFAERDATSQGGLFGTVTVTGQCLGPDDPGYADAVAHAKAAGAGQRRPSR